MSLRMTGSQTVGPFFELGLGWLYTREIGTAAASGERIEIRGHVYDGAGQPVPDALLEVWQADAHGRYPGAQPAPEFPVPEFLGFGRIPSDARGGFAFHTIKPGRVPGPDGTEQAAHLSLHVFMRGLLLPLHTRLYFPDDPAHARDAVLQRVPAARRSSLIARVSAEGFLVWDIYTQGEQEIVCFRY